MKRLSLTMLLAVTAASLLPMLPLSAQSVSYNAVYQGNPSLGTVILNGLTYTTVSYPGLYNTMEPGMPSLPVEYIRFSVPWNATDFRLTATGSDVESIPLDYPIYPFQPLDGGTVTQLDATAYATGSIFPSQLAWVTGEDRLAGENHTVTVAVMPMAYSRGVTGDTLQVAESVNLALSYSLIDPTGLKPMYRRDTTLRNKGFDFTRSLVVNPADVRGNAVPFGLSNIRMPVLPEEPTGDPLTYMIITSQDLRHSLRRLAALKKQKGINVKIVTLSEAINDPWASAGDYYYDQVWGDSLLTYTDDAGKLRQYLKINYFYNGTEYALLAGDIVPYRTWDNYDTDVYFSDMYEDWMYRNHGCGDLCVGRLFGSTCREFDNYTDKLFRYELNPGRGDRSYLERALSTVGFGYETLDGTYHMESIFTNVSCLKPETDEYELTGCDLLDSINTKRYGFINTFNDGFPSGIKVYGEDLNEVSHYLWAIDTAKVAPDVADSETGNGLNQMDNKYYPAVYLSSMGQTMPFHNVAGYGSGANYGKSFTMGKDYGGPVFVGLTRGINQHQASLFTNTLFENISLYGSDLVSKIIRTKIGLKSIHNTNVDLIHSYNYLGDPALRLWTVIPLEYIAVTVARTNSAVSLTGLSAGDTVSYCSNDGSVGRVLATSSSVSLTDVDPNSTIMVYQHNRIPYIAPLVIQNTDLDRSQYVIASEVLAGRNVDSSRTNGDVTVKNGAEYEIEAASEVTLAGGFTVEKGAAFAIRPACF